VTEQFTVRGSNLITTELLGVWQTEPAPDTSYGLAGVDDGGDVVWSASLPEDAALASQALQASIEGLSVSQQALRQAERTLEYLPPDWLDQEEILDYGVGPPDAKDLSTSPELETLRRNISHLVGDDAEAISYGLGVPDRWQGTVDGYKDFINEMAGLLRPTLITETRFAETMLAVTVVGLTGNLETTWYQRGTAERDFAHRQVVALSLGTRMALLQLLGQISAGASVLAAKTGLGTPLLALPAAWRYFQDVVQQAQKVAELGRQI
jgi:hypothetical protein